MIHTIILPPPLLPFIPTAEIKLYLMVLEKLSKIEKRLEVITGPLGKYPNCYTQSYQWFSLLLGHIIRNKDELNHMELECYLSLHRWDEAAVLLTQMLQRNPDQWSHIEVYVSCQIQRYKKSIQDAKLEYEKTKKGKAMAESNGEGEGEGEMGSVEDEEEGGTKEGVWEGKGEKEEEEEGEGENGRNEELDEKMNQLNISEGGPNREIPM